MYPFRNKSSFYCVVLLKPRPTPKLEDQPLLFVRGCYSIYLHLPSILEAVPTSVTWGRAMPWWQEPTYHGKDIQYGLVLRRFALRRFNFTTIAETDRALPTFSASLSQLKRPFSTQCTSSSFPVCLCFLFLYFSAVILSWLWFLHPWRPSKRRIVLFCKKKWKGHGRL